MSDPDIIIFKDEQCYVCCIEWKGANEWIKKIKKRRGYKKVYVRITLVYNNRNPLDLKTLKDDDLVEILLYGEK